MATDARIEVTTALCEPLATGADAERVLQRLLPAVYDELRRLASHYLKNERPGHTLQATALVHEAYLRLVDQDRVEWQGKTHFFAIAAQAMRRVLVDHARRRLRAKRGGDLQRVTLDDDFEVGGAEGLAIEDILALDEAITKLAGLDPRQASLVEQRFFAGRTVAEVAQYLGVSQRTAEGDWAHAKAWLSRELGDRPT